MRIYCEKCLEEVNGYGEKTEKSSWDIDWLALAHPANGCFTLQELQQLSTHIFCGLVHVNVSVTSSYIILLFVSFLFARMRNKSLCFSWGWHIQIISLNQKQTKGIFHFFSQNICVSLKNVSSPSSEKCDVIKLFQMSTGTRVSSWISSEITSSPLACDNSP